MPDSLLDLWWEGVNAVRGEAAVQSALPELDAAPTLILAVGKAACDMARPAMRQFPGVPVLIVTKHGHGADLPGAATVIEAGHPIPDAASLEGGAALVSAVEGCGASDHLLMLVSGGASAVAELLPDGMTLESWRSETDALIASGCDIHTINQRRREVSRIKGGKLLSLFKGARVTTLAISDVEGDALDVIGSGIGAAPDSVGFDFTAKIVASNAIARASIANRACEEIVANEEVLYDDVQRLAPVLGERILSGPKGVYIFGGEPTVRLPDAPGRGGRNQALALLLAREIAGSDGIEILVAGTDGTDGPTTDAGALVDGETWAETATEALLKADSGRFLDARNALIKTGPTGTNVMDLVIARKA